MSDKDPHPSIHKKHLGPSLCQRSASFKDPRPSIKPPNLSVCKESSVEELRPSVKELRPSVKELRLSVRSCLLLT